MPPAAEPAPGAKPPTTSFAVTGAAAIGANSPTTSPTLPPGPRSVDQVLGALARHNRLRPGDPILKGTRFTVAYGGQPTPQSESYLLLDRGHVVQRREVRFDPNQRRTSIGGYVGDRHLEHHLRVDERGLLAGHVQDQSTREREELSLCVDWPGAKRNR